MNVRFQTVVLLLSLALAARGSVYAQNAAPGPTLSASPGASSGLPPTGAPPRVSLEASPRTPLNVPAPAPARPAASAPVDYGRLREAVSELIRTEMKKNDVVGLSIALVDDQRLVWAQGFGYADEENKVPATPETVYRAGTLTKLFTATAVMQLAEQGMLDVDRPLTDYLPEVSIKTRFANGGPLTARHLLISHSGLPSRLLKGMWSRKPEPFTKIPEQIRNEHAAYPPGFIYSNSDLDFTLLGLLVQRVSGRDFVSSLDETLLKPLDMMRSSLLPAPGKNKGTTKSYYKGGSIETPSSRDIPAYGLQSSVTDLSRFMQMIFAHGRFGQRQILKPETLTEMLRVQNRHVPLDFGLRMGLGWMLSGFGDVDIRNAGLVAHFGGASLLHRSQLIVLPAQKLGVVVMANAPATATVNMIAVRALTLALEIKAGIKQPEQKKPVEVDTSLPSSLVQAYEGCYATTFGVGNITANADHLNAEVMNRSFHLVPHADGKFGIRYKFLSFIPIRLSALEQVSIFRERIAGREVLVTSVKGRQLLVGEKIKAVPISPAWQKRVGDYAIENLGDDFPLVDRIRLSMDKGFLIVECSLPLISARGAVSYALEPLSDTEAVIRGLGSGMAETLRVANVNGRELLSYSGYLLRKK